MSEFYYSEKTRANLRTGGVACIAVGLLMIAYGVAQNLQLV